MVSHMMSPRAERPPRDHVAVRLSTDGMQYIRAMADEETEGNISMMIRKLLSEAIAARQKKPISTTPAMDGR